VVLGKGLLKNRWPERAILANLSAVCGECSIFLFKKRKVIVDDDCVRDTKSVEINAIDAVGVNIVVKEDTL